MSRPTVYARGLDIVIAASRLPPLVWLALVLVLGSAAAQVWWLGDLREQSVAWETQLRGLRHPGAAVSVAPAVRIPESIRRLREFQGALGSPDHREELIRAMFATAKRSGLVLAEGEYVGAPDKSGMYDTLEVSQPVHGTYAQVRAYCEQTLMAVPFAALDGLQFKREGVGTETGEARLRWTYYLRPPEPAASAPPSRRSGR